MEKRKCFIGIDVGSKGGLVYLIEPTGEILFGSKQDYSIVESIKFNIVDYINTLISLSKDFNLYITIEKVHSMPKQGVKSMFSFGERLGEINGILKAIKHYSKNKVNIIYITPQEWKQHFNLIGSDKKESCKKAIELEPTLKCKGSRGGYLDGVCDAYLIMKYGKEKKWTKEY